MKTPLIVTAVKSGQEFVHHGSIIFKAPVPDNVKATAHNGGILLEQGGGDGLILKASGSDFANGVRKVWAQGSGAPVMPGNIESRGGIGNDVMIRAAGSVQLARVGDGLNANAGGSFQGQSIGNKPSVLVDGSLIVHERIGAQAYIGAEGSLRAYSLAAGGIYRVGGSASITESIGELVQLTAGGSVMAMSVLRGAHVKAGGSILVNSSEAGTRLEAGGVIQAKPGFLKP